MRTIVSYINNLIFPLIPESKGYGFKRAMLRLAGADVGKNVKISSSLKIYGAGKLVVGDNTWIGYQTIIVSSSDVKIGANVDIAPRVYIGTGTHIIDVNSDHIAAKNLSKDIKIGNGCWICVNSTILPGVEIGNKCVVAAGSVVCNPCTEDYYLIGGHPAKKLKKYE